MVELYLLAQLLIAVERIERKVNTLMTETSGLQTDIDQDTTVLSQVLATLQGNDATLQAVTGQLQEIIAAAPPTADTSKLDAAVQQLQTLASGNTAAVQGLQALVPAPAAGTGTGTTPAAPPADGASGNPAAPPAS